MMMRVLAIMMFATACLDQPDQPDATDATEQMATITPPPPPTYSCAWLSAGPLQHHTDFSATDAKDACISCFDVEGPAGFNQIMTTCWKKKLVKTCWYCSNETDGANCGDVPGAFVELGTCSY
jgi:hypothetical protein